MVAATAQSTPKTTSNFNMTKSLHKKKHQLAVRWSDLEVVACQQQLQQSPPSTGVTRTRTSNPDRNHPNLHIPRPNDLIVASCSGKHDENAASDIDSTLHSKRQVDDPDNQCMELHKLLQIQLRKKQIQIRKACKLELHYLNQSQKIREKRMRMVMDLQHLENQILLRQPPQNPSGGNVVIGEDNQGRTAIYHPLSCPRFPLPPVFCTTAFVHPLLPDQSSQKAPQHHGTCSPQRH
jgi:hypothetical protein